MMRTLYENKYAPLTFSWGFLEAPLSKVGDTYAKWRNTHFGKVEISPASGELGDLLSMLEPLTTVPRRELLVATQSSWTAFFDNGVNGGDPFGPISHLAEVLGCRGILVRNIEETKATYGAVQFELYGPKQTEWLNYIRAVGAVNDGGKWVFIDEGTALPFERGERYKAEKIKDRFTAELLEEYCLAFGIRLFDRAFYGPEALISFIGDPMPEGHLSMSLSAARKRLSLKE